MEITGDYRKGPADKKSSRIKAQLEQTLNVGGEGDVSFARTQISGSDGKEKSAGRYVIKHLVNEFNDEEIKPENIVKKHRWLKQRGFPVVPTLRYDETTNTLIMTDLTSGGEKLVVDRHKDLPSCGVTAEQIENWKEIEREARSLAAKVFSGGMAFNKDNYALVLEKSGDRYKAKIYFVDLGYGAYIIADGTSEPKTIERQLSEVNEFLSLVQRNWDRSTIK